MDIHVARALVALFPRHQIDIANVGNEVGVQNAAVVLREIFSLLGEKLGVAGIEAVFELIVGFVDKFRIAVEFEGDRLTGERKIARRLAAAGVEVLVPSIQWYREGAAALPLKSALGRC